MVVDKPSNPSNSESETETTLNQKAIKQAHQAATHDRNQKRVLTKPNERAGAQLQQPSEKPVPVRRPLDERCWHHVVARRVVDGLGRASEFKTMKDARPTKAIDSPETEDPNLTTNVRYK